MSGSSQLSGDRKDLEPLRVLITGGCGFIGSAVVRHLAQGGGAHVLNIDKLTYAGDLAALAEVACSSRYRFRHADVCNGEVVGEEFDSFQPNWVIHLAAESHVDRSIDAPAAFIETNVVGTVTLLEAALHYWQHLPEGGKSSFRFLHVSTDEVYGSLPLAGGAFTEESAYAPNSPYAASKAAADHLARAWQRTYGLPVMISNCSNNFGPFQFPEKLIPTAIIAALESRPIPIYGDGGNTRDWLYVDEHVRALLAILQRGQPGKTYLVGAKAEMSNVVLVRTICRLLDELVPASPARPHEQLITFVPDRPGHDRRYAIDPARLRSELDWRPQESFPSALRKTIQWYLDNRDWWQRIRRERYGGERLGLGLRRVSSQVDAK